MIVAMHTDSTPLDDGAAVWPVVLRRTVAWVAALNLAYFGVEFTVARAIGSVSLFADSIDFLEDTAVNLLVLLGLSWPARRRAMLAIGLALLLLVPGALTLWTAWHKFLLPVPPAPLPLTLAALGALVVNLFCAWLLARVRAQGGSLLRAAYLSARNDAVANIAIVAAALVTLASASAWPDLIVGLGIFLLNADAAREVLGAARRELEPVAPPA
jgi:Co/Zn/Cd efflux system component